MGYSFACWSMGTKSRTGWLQENICRTKKFVWTHFWRISKRNYYMPAWILWRIYGVAKAGFKVQAIAPQAAIYLYDTNGSERDETQNGKVLSSQKRCYPIHSWRSKILLCSALLGIWLGWFFVVPPVCGYMQRERDSWSVSVVEKSNQQSECLNTNLIHELKNCLIFIHFFAYRLIFTAHICRLNYPDEKQLLYHHGLRWHW